MEEIRGWFEEAKVLRVYNCGDHEFTIEKGFKVTHYFEDDTYSVLDTRFNDFYTEVSEANMKIFRDNGFLKGTNIIMYERNVRRVDRYLRLIEGLYTKIASYKKLLSKDKVFYTKRIKNCKENIHDYHDLMQLYKSRVDQFEGQNKN